jgi:predicted GTPase
LCYEKIVNDRNCLEYVINLANAKGFLGDFISTDIHFRSNVRKFVQRINEYTKSTGYTRPLNCLIFAESGSGKSFFVNQLASEANCEIVTVNCNQTLSKPEVLKDSLIKKKWGENEVFSPQEIKK